jgi:eukaryotic-like serine/threonine-protein kinase
MLGQTLKNHYRIEQKLGNGSFGQTYLAADLRYRTQPRVVIKHLQPDYSRCRSEQQKQELFESARRLFDREAQTLTKLGRFSPQIPSMLEDFTENDQFYIAQEWIDGEPLSCQLPHGQRWTQQQTIQLLIEILEPLNFCHQEGVIHRDLKPENLMRRRLDRKLVIIDFGAVREVGQLGTCSPLQPAGSSVGTPGYMPYEQVQGYPVLASDIYAVGAIGIQAMTGYYPHEIAPDPSGIPNWRQMPNCYATAAFAAVLNRMLAILPQGRYGNAAEALAALLPLRVPGVQLPVAPAPIAIAPVQSFGTTDREVFNFETVRLSKVERQAVAAGHPSLPPEWQMQRTVAQAERFKEDLGNGIQLEMVHVPGGKLLMGSPAGEGHNDEKPQHWVTVPSFAIGRFPVTQEQYGAIVGGNPSLFKGEKLPVERVSWFDAQAFCRKLRERTGKPYHLPSEAEWEYACRGESTKLYNYGEILTTAVANYNGRCSGGVGGDYREKTTAIGSFPPNDFGLHDMHGNVWEWCEDGWHDHYHGAPQNGQPWVSRSTSHVLRGGSWISSADFCRSASRIWYYAVDHYYNIGFRVVCGVE